MSKSTSRFLTFVLIFVLKGPREDWILGSRLATSHTRVTCPFSGGETFNPLGFTVQLSFSRWEVLWSGEPTKVLTPQARQFSPNIKHINFPTNLLRIEVNSSLLDYYTELDAVILRGVKERPMLARYKMPIIDINDLSDSEEELSDLGGPFRQGGEAKRTGNGYFDKLPYEVIPDFTDIVSDSDNTLLFPLEIRFCATPFRMSQMKNKILNININIGSKGKNVQSKDNKVNKNVYIHIIK